MEKQNLPLPLPLILPWSAQEITMGQHIAMEEGTLELRQVMHKDMTLQYGGKGEE